MTRSVTRRFNYTRRVDIPQADVDIDLRHEGATLIVSVMRLVLSCPAAHSEEDWNQAHVTLEAWRTDLGAYQRFVMGTVAELAVRSPVFAAVLPEFPDEHNVTFRIKVTSAESKRILAEADRLLATKDERRRDELIKVFPRDLGELPWTVDWSDQDEGPKVFVNTNIERNRDLLTRDAVVRGLVVPSVLREVLYRAVAEPGIRQLPWARQWLEFGVRCAGTELPDEDSDDIDDWIDSVLKKFAAIHSLSSAIEEEHKKEESA